MLNSREPLYSARTGPIEARIDLVHGKQGARIVAARIIHIGVDTCHRLPVLESAGYQVSLCRTVLQLQEAFAAEDQLDAVLISEAGGWKHQDAVSLARSHCSAPIVLFRDTQRSVAESAFDLVVPVLNHPEEWLAEIGALIRRSQVLQAEESAA